MSVTIRLEMWEDVIETETSEPKAIHQCQVEKDIAPRAFGRIVETIQFYAAYESREESKTS
jgi:hypothetical protein